MISSNHSPTLNLAIWEEAYQQELKVFWEVAKSKARRINYLENVDPYSIPEEKAKRQFWELQKLNEELNALVGFKNHVDELKSAYLKTSVWLGEYTIRKEQFYCRQVNELKKSYHSLNQLFESSSFWEMRYLETILNTIEEAKSNGYTLHSLNHIWR